MSVSGTAQGWLNRLTPKFIKHIEIQGWEHPSFKECTDSTGVKQAYCKAENNKIIKMGEPMINFKRKSTKNYESKHRRFYRARQFKNDMVTYTRRNTAGNPIETHISDIVPGTAHFYEAKNAPVMVNGKNIGRYFKQGERYPDENVNKILDSKLILDTYKEHVAQSASIFKLANPKANVEINVNSFDFTKMQKLLQDPKTTQQAADALRNFKLLLQAAKVHDREQFERAEAVLSKIETATGIIGWGLGFASGAEVAAAVASGIEHSSLAGSIATEIMGLSSKATQAGAFSAIKSVAEIAAESNALLSMTSKITTAVLVGTATAATGPGFAVAVAAMVVATVGLVAHAEGNVQKKQRLTTELGGDQLIVLIDNLIKNNGVLEEVDNPMFEKARKVKAILNATGKKGANLRAYIDTMPNSDDKIQALVLADQMNANAAGISSFCNATCQHERQLKEKEKQNARYNTMRAKHTNTQGGKRKHRRSRTMKSFRYRQ